MSAVNPGVRSDTYRDLRKSITCPCLAMGHRGGDIDKNGVVWASLSSGHLASFERSKCKGPLNGPTATGEHCPEGWSFYTYPDPVQGRAGRQQCRVELLHVGRPA